MCGRASYWIRQRTSLGTSPSVTVTESAVGGVQYVLVSNPAVWQSRPQHLRMPDACLCGKRGKGRGEAARQAPPHTHGERDQQGT